MAVFRAYPQQRNALMDEVLSTVIAHITLAGSKGPPRLYEATDAAQRPLHIQMATALVLQLVQVGEDRVLMQGKRGVWCTVLCSVFYAWAGVCGLPASNCGEAG